MDIVVVGAGIGGLAAAIALSQKGHRVRVLERYSGLSEFGAGLQIGSNAVRLLCGWGLEDDINKLVFEPRMSVARRYSSGEILGRTCQNPAAEINYGFPYWQIYRPDFQRLLAEGAAKSGAKIEYGMAVREVDVQQNALILSNGVRITADLIVCADGIQSQCRRAILESANADPIPFNKNNYRAIIPRADMLSIPETSEMIKSRDTQAFFGPGCAIICYPISAGKLFNIAIISHPHPNEKGVKKSPRIGRWNESTDLEAFRGLFEDFCPTVKTLLSLVRDCTRWTIAEVPELKSWSSSSGRMILLGDAAHAMSPHAAQGSAMAIEDAAVLAECLVHFRDNIGAAVDAYQSIRMPRVKIIADIARGNGNAFVFSDGPEQEARDRRFRATSVDEDNFVALEEKLRERPKPVADPNAKWPSPGLMMWMNGFDSIAEAKKSLQQL